MSKREIIYVNYKNPSKMLPWLNKLSNIESINEINNNKSYGKNDTHQNFNISSRGKFTNDFSNSRNYKNVHSNN